MPEGRKSFRVHFPIRGSTCFHKETREGKSFLLMQVISAVTRTNSLNKSLTALLLNCCIIKRGIYDLDLLNARQWNDL